MVWPIWLDRTKQSTLRMANMKTAEEYAHELCCALSRRGAVLSYQQERYLKSCIAESFPAIQIAAMKEGMRRASEVLYKAWHDENKSPRQCEYAILAVAEQLTEKDL